MKVLRSALMFSMFMLVLGDLARLSAQSAPSFNVLTWQIDVGRTGQNLAETTLTTGSIQTGAFGQLCHVALDGQVYAQPLIVTNVTMTVNGVPTNYPSVAYVATQNGTLYAINGTPPTSGTTCQVVTQMSLLSASSPIRYPADCHYIGRRQCGTITPSVGVLGTPVINANVVSGQPTTGTLYAVVETQNCAGQCNPTNLQHTLYAVDISSLQITGSVQVFPPSAKDPTAKSHFSQTHIQRPGLLYANGSVFVAVSLMDGSGNPGPNGAIFQYQATNLTGTYGYFPTTPDATPAGGGVRQGGAGLAAGFDGTNSYIYFGTGNGTFSGTNAVPCSTECADSFIKLNPATMTVADSFTPYDQYYRSNLPNCGPPNGNGGDVDFGSGGVMLIPDNELSTWPYLAVTGDKEGGIWIQNRSSLGKYNAGSGNQCNASCSCTSTDTIVQTVWTGAPHAGQVIHNTPGYWESGGVNGTNYLYVSTQKDFTHNTPGALSQYTLCDAPSPICGGPVVATDTNNLSIDFGYGATPNVSAPSVPATHAVLWALWKPDGSAEGTTQGKLYAFDAVSMKQLYASSGTGSTCEADAINPTTKFSVPTVANGNVYVGAESDNVTTLGQGTFYIFGLNRTCN